MTAHAHLEPLLSDLLDVCEVFTTKMKEAGPTLLSKKAQRTTKLVFDEPFIPYLPSNAPKVLVLAESQNLSSASNPDYVKHLEALGPEGRPLRLIHGEQGSEKLGIQPWDDGILKLSLRAALDLDPSTVAVSNAIPWSWVQGKANARPFTSKVLAMAGAFWQAIFDVWQPELVVAAGAAARDVMRATNLPPAQVLNWILPSPRLGPAASMLDGADLMRRFEIDEDVQRQIAASDEGLRARLAFYVCHAVSKTDAAGSNTYFKGGR